MSDKLIQSLANELHAADCPCCSHLSGVAGTTSRRQFLATGAAVVAGGLIGFMPGRASAASGNYEAMLVNCIDPRFTTLSWQYMGLLSGVDREKLGDNYSHFVMAGGPIGAVHPKFVPWHKTYWDNLDITVGLHHIKRVVALSHRDCGAAKLAFGADKVGERDMESMSHAEALMAFRKEVNTRHPKLSVITGIMDLKGRVDLIG
ncbi:MAG: twin-arginine translocation signal domain-containing protein [Betaproteobacteria bacterium]